MGHLHRITKLYASNGPWPLPFPITDSKKGYGCQNMRDYKILPTQIIVKEQLFYCCSTFNSHCRVFDNEHNSYPKMSVKCPKPCSLSGTLCLCHFKILICNLFLDFLKMYKKKIQNKVLQLCNNNQYKSFKMEKTLENKTQIHYVLAIFNYILNLMKYCFI